MTTLLDRFAASAAHGGAITVARSGDREARTHERIVADADGLARGLRSEGIGPGTRVGIVLAADLDAVTALVAVWRAGATVVALPPPSRVGDRMAWAAQIDGILTRTGAIRLPPVTTRAGGRLDGPAPEQEALVKLTSGTAGASRPVVKTHAALVAQCDAHAATKGGLVPGVDRRVGWAPLHRRALGADVLYPMAFGVDSTLVPTDRFAARPRAWLEEITRAQATFSSGPTFAYRLAAVALERDHAGIDLSSWRVAHCGGELVDAAVLERFVAAAGIVGFDADALCPSYGLSETGGVAARHGLRVDVIDPIELERGTAVRAPEGIRVASMGRPAPGVEVRIGAGDGPERAIGEIAVRTPGAMVDASGWFATGDAGYLADDELHVLGRIDDVIVVRGRSIHPFEIEQPAASAPGAGAAVAFEAGEHIVVVVEHAAALDVQRAIAPLGLAPVIATVGRGVIADADRGKSARAVVRRAYLDGTLGSR